jgi:hypothetical protein
MRGAVVVTTLSVALLALALSPGCKKLPAPDPDEQAPAWFEDVTDRLGIDFTHDPGPLDGTLPLRQIVGSGVAVFDADGDGLLDLYFLNNGGPGGRPNRLYRQKADGTFEDISSGSGLDFADFCMGVTVGDVNDDGRPDLLVTQASGVRLLLNRGGGKFEDVTKRAGLDNPAWATGAAFLDYDRDGRLDLVVVNYVAYDPTLRCFDAHNRADYCSPNVFAPVAARLFRNLGEQDGVPRFRDVSAASGLGKLPGPGLGVVCADFDGDGWPDVFVANDGKQNHLWINQRDGTFKNEAVARGVAFDGMGNTQAGMGVALGDVDGDGLFDLFITHLTSEQHTLWKLGPRGRFRDRSTDSKLHTPKWRGTGFGTVLADFDHDGAPEVALVHGRVTRTAGDAYRPLGGHWGAYAERNQLLVNDGTGRFRDASTANPDLCGTPNVARGLAVGDLDRDGALDVVLTTVAGRARVLRNVAPDRGHWLKVRLLEASGKRAALGAEVALRAGGRRQVRIVRTADSFLSSSDEVTHFGLGKATAYDEVEVLWPSGKPRRERFAGGRADAPVTLRQGTGEALAEKP